MMQLDPRPLNPDDLNFQENARLMAHIAELTQGRDLGGYKEACKRPLAGTMEQRIARACGVLEAAKRKHFTL